MDKSSRNSPSAGIYSRVDLWCAGQRPAAAAVTVKFTNSVLFSSSSASNWYTQLFARPDGSHPVNGNVFIALPYGPVLTLPPTMVVNGITYGQATPANPLGTTSGGVSYAYQIVHRTGAWGWSPYSDFGLEWVSSMLPPNGVPVVISAGYTYNDIPLAIQQNLESWRLAGTDVWAHQGVQVALQFSLAVIYDPAVSQAVTQAALSAALSSYLSQLGFNSRVYPSSVLQVAESTPGVIASRFLVGADYPGYNPASPNNYNTAIQAVYGGVVTATYADSAGNPVDIEFGDDTIPVFGGLVLVAKAGNTMGSFA
jgi:hypothetical protein